MDHSHMNIMQLVIRFFFIFQIKYKNVYCNPCNPKYTVLYTPHGTLSIVHSVPFSLTLLKTVTP